MSKTQNVSLGIKYGGTNNKRKLLSLKNPTVQTTNGFDPAYIL